MKLSGTVDTLSDNGESVTVTVTNIRRRRAAGWQSYFPNIQFHVGHRQAARSYPIGTTVEVIVRPKK